MPLKKIILLLYILFFAYPLYSQEKLLFGEDEGYCRLGGEFNSQRLVVTVSIISGDYASFDSLVSEGYTSRIIRLHENSLSEMHLEKNGNWLYINISSAGFKSLNKQLVVKIVKTGSVSKIYWDSTLLWQKENEAVSSVSNFGLEMKIPFDLTDNGYHVIKMKLEKANGNIAYLPSGILLALEEQIIESRIRDEYIKIFLMAIFLTSGLFYLILFFAFNRSWSFIIFSAFCLVNSYHIFNNPPWALFGSYNPSNTNYSAFAYLIFILSCALLILFLVVKFNLFRINKIAAIIILLAPLYFFPFGEMQYSIAIYALVLGIIIFAVIKKKEGGWFLLAGFSGFIILFILQYINLLQYGYFTGIIFFIIGVSILSAKEIVNQSKKHRQAVLKASQLENELLKKNIQPHFIMNTLMSLQEVVEQEPEKASPFIQALAEEFSMFSKISDEKLVSVNDEFKLCHSHLRIMGFRKEAEFELVVSGFNGGEKVPPGIFHSLIENGTTHGYINKRSGVFTITKELIQQGVRYIIFNDSENTGSGPISKGTGIKYIESRLEESFPGRWKLECQRLGIGFETVITIFENKA